MTDKSDKVEITQDELKRVMTVLGQRKSPKKAAASRANGKLGGDPRKFKKKRKKVKP